MLTTRSVSTSRDSGLVVKRVASQWLIFAARGRPGGRPRGRLEPFDGDIFSDGAFLRAILSWARLFLVSREVTRGYAAAGRRRNGLSYGRMVTVGDHGLWN